MYVNRKGSGGRRKAGAALVLSTLLLGSRFAAAQTLNEQEIEQGRSAGLSPTGWDATLGAGLAVRPVYEGADTHRLGLAPMGMVSYDRGAYFAGPAGIGLGLNPLPNLRIGPVLGFIGGRKQDADAELNGLGDIPPSLTAGVFAVYRMGPFRLDGTVRQSIIHQANGLYGNLKLDWVKPMPQRRLLLDLGPAVDFANGSYNRTFFGVSPQQSEQSGYVVPPAGLYPPAPQTGLPPYTPSGGIKDVAFNAVLDYQLSQRWLLRGFAGVERLVGADGNSPIVQNKTQDFVGVGVEYHFGSGPMPMGGGLQR
jgi:MipA family protein